MSLHSDNLSRVIESYNLNPTDPSPIFIPNTSRIMLAELFAMLDYKRGAEVGVGSGVYSEIICQKVPGVELYCIDAWQSYSDYMDFTDDHYLEGDYQIAKRRLEPYNVRMIRKFSVDAAGDLEDGSLDFVYIDANHFQPYVSQDLEAWEPKVRSGGIVSGHDYTPVYGQVIEAVNEFVAEHGISPLFLMGKQGLISTDVADITPSFFWVKP
jgi:hypothetical protein